jgi:hypothetical protein
MLRCLRTSVQQWSIRTSIPTHHIAQLWLASVRTDTRQLEHKATLCKTNLFPFFFPLQLKSKSQGRCILETAAWHTHELRKHAQSGIEAKGIPHHKSSSVIPGVVFPGQPLGSQAAIYRHLTIDGKRIPFRPRGQWDFTCRVPRWL